MKKTELESFLTKINFNNDDISYLSSIFTSLLNMDNSVFDSYINRFKNKDDFHKIFNDFKTQYKGLYHEYTLDLVLLIVLSEQVKESYIKSNISLDVFYSTLEDLTYKLNECKKVYNVVGTFVYWWYEGIYNLNIFKLGRLEYEYAKFEGEYNNDGIIIKDGDDVISIHIPNTGEKLTRLSVLESLKLANKFFNKKVIYICSSWLLYYKNKERFKEGSNLMDFFDMFDIYNNFEEEKYGELWRVFDSIVDLNHIDNLKKETSLQKTFIEVIKNKENTGYGCGVLKKEYY